MDRLDGKPKWYGVGKCELCWIEFNKFNGVQRICRECKNKMVPCKCGCGGQVRTEGRGMMWLAGHHMRRSSMKRQLANEVREHRRLTNVPVWNKGLTKETCEGVAQQASKVKGRTKTLEHREKLRLAVLGRKQSDATKLKRGKSLRRAWKSARKAGSGWFTRESKKKRSDGAKKRSFSPWGQWRYMGKQNPAESSLEKILDRYFPEEFRYVGTRKVCIGRRFPDFIGTNGRKEIVELFGEKVHGPEFTGRRRCDETKARKRHFKKFGFVTAVVWTNELRGNPNNIVESVRSQLRRAA